MLQQVVLRRHGVAAKQVGDVHLLDIIDLYPPGGQVGECRHASYVQWVAIEQLEDFLAPRAGGRRQCEQHFLGSRHAEHLLQVLGLVDLKPGNHPTGNIRVIIDEGYRSHQAPHAKRGHQLVACRTGAIDGDPGQAVVTVGEGQTMPPHEPVAHEVLAHGQTQAADYD
ncbi:hypothetical protein D3C77_358110 [compost metagenome]